MKAWALGLVLALAVGPVSELPRVTRKQEVEQQLGNRVTVVGVYRQLNVNQNQHQPPRYQGNVYLELSDGGAVAIGKPGDPARARSAEEIAALEGKPVSASGTLIKSGGAGPTAQLVMPYLAKLEALAPVAR